MEPEVVVAIDWWGDAAHNYNRRIELLATRMSPSHVSSFAARAAARQSNARWLKTKLLRHGIYG